MKTMNKIAKKTVKQQSHPVVLGGNSQNYWGKIGIVTVIIIMVGGLIYYFQVKGKNNDNCVVLTS